MKTFFTFLLALTFTFTAWGNEVPLANGADLTVSSFTEGFKVYPNPSITGKFTLEFYTLNFEEQITIKIFNLIGKEVYRNKISSHMGIYQESINIHRLPKGMYLLEISNGEDKQVRRISYT